MKYVPRTLEERDKERRKKTVHDHAIVAENYGGRCYCCGRSDLDSLTIDHLDGDGAEERVGQKNHNINQVLISQGLPKTRKRTMCGACNKAKGHYRDGRCRCRFWKFLVDCGFVRPCPADWEAFDRGDFDCLEDDWTRLPEAEGGPIELPPGFAEEDSPGVVGDGGVPGDPGPVGGTGSPIGSGD